MGLGDFGGIFRDKKVRTVSAWADMEELVMPEYRTNIVKQYLLGAIHQDLDIATAIRASHLAGYSYKYKKFVNKALTTSTPPVTSEFKRIRDEDILTIETIIKDLYGTTAFIDTIDFDIINPRYFAYKWLYQNWLDYNDVAWRPWLETVTININSYELGEPVVLRAPVNDPDVTYDQDYWSTHMLGIFFKWSEEDPDNPYGDPIEYEYKVTEQDIRDLAPTVTNWINPYDINIYHVVIGFTDDSDKFRFWEYDIRRNTHPSLKGSISTWGTWSPVAILYQDQQPFYNYPDRVDSVASLLDIFGLDAREVVDTLIADIPPTLPDGTRFTDAFVLFGLVPDVKIESHNKYVIEFVKEATNLAGEFSLPDEYHAGIGTTITIGGENGYVYATGIDPPITYKVTTEYEAPGIIYSDPDDLYSDFLGYRFTTPHIDPGYWEIVTIGGVSGVLLVNGPDGNTHYANTEVFINFQDFEDFKAPPSISYLQLNSLALNRLNNKDLEEIFQASLRIVCAGTSVQVTRIPWYAKDSFKIILIVVTVVLIVISRTPVFLKWLAIAIPSAQVYTFVLFAINALTSALIGITAQIVIGGLGGTLVGAFFTMGLMGGFSTLSSMNFNMDVMWKNLFTIEGFGNVVKMLKQVSDIYLYKQQLKMQKDFKQELEEQNSMLSSLNQKQQELEDSMLALEGGNNIDPWLIFRGGPSILQSEEPKNFYARKLDTNPGLKTFRLIPEYVTLSLELPEGDGENPALALNAFPTPGVQT